MAKIEIYTRPVKHFEFMGNYAPQHSYIVTSYDHQKEKHAIRAGTQFNEETKENVNPLYSDIEIIAKSYRGGFPDYPGPEEQDPRSLPDEKYAKLHKNHHITLLVEGGDRDIKEMWDAMWSERLRIKKQGYDYKLPTFGLSHVQNCNTVIKALVEAAGLIMVHPVDENGKKLWLPGIEGTLHHTVPDMFIKVAITAITNKIEDSNTKEQIVQIKKYFEPIGEPPESITLDFTLDQDLTYAAIEDAAIHKISLALNDISEQKTPGSDLIYSKDAFELRSTLESIYEGNYYKGTNINYWKNYADEALNAIPLFGSPNLDLNLIYNQKNEDSSEIVEFSPLTFGEFFDENNHFSFLDHSAEQEDQITMLREMKSENDLILTKHADNVRGGLQGLIPDKDHITSVYSNYVTDEVQESCNTAIKKAFLTSTDDIKVIKLPGIFQTKYNEHIDKILPEATAKLCYGREVREDFLTSQKEIISSAYKEYIAPHYSQSMNAVEDYISDKKAILESSYNHAKEEVGNLITDIKTYISGDLQENSLISFNSNQVTELLDDMAVYANLQTGFEKALDIFDEKANTKLASIKQADDKFLQDIYWEMRSESRALHDTFFKSALDERSLISSEFSSEVTSAYNQEFEVYKEYVYHEYLFPKYDAIFGEYINDLHRGAAHEYSLKNDMKQQHLHDMVLDFN